MSTDPNDNVVLFPKSVEYYRLQLTGLLESEQYEEAARLLRFLLKLQAEDKQVVKEWQSLLEWIEESFSLPVDDEDVTESELFKRHIQEKARHDPQYTKNLLGKLLDDTPLDHKMLALEQLMHIDQPQINDILIRWLQQVDLHPLIEFKVLQTLRHRGARGELTLNRCGESVRLEIEETPMAFEDFPEPMQAVLAKIRAVSEVHHPAMLYFAEQTWRDFLHYIYAGALYREIASGSGRDADLWASALHQIVLEAMLGGGNARESRAYYGVEDASYDESWRNKYGQIGKYFESAIQRG